MALLGSPAGWPATQPSQLQFCWWPLGGARAEESEGQVGREAHLGGSEGPGGASYLGHFSREAPTQAWGLHSATGRCRRTHAMESPPDPGTRADFTRSDFPQVPFPHFLFQVCKQSPPPPQEVACLFIFFVVFSEAPTV